MLGLNYYPGCDDDMPYPTLENPTPAPKPLWLIADEWMMKARELMDENAQLTAENARLAAELARCQSNDYAGDIEADSEDGGRGVQERG